jgi:excinuclease ABC subunit A
MRRPPARLSKSSSIVLLRAQNKKRICDSLEQAFHYGKGRIGSLPPGRRTGAASLSAIILHCPHCDISYRDPVPNLFSFNSPLGACETCRGFGRVIDIDLDLVIPDPGKSLATAPSGRGSTAPGARAVS